MKISTKIIEFLAEKVHQRWMNNRQIEGWKYGEIRNDIKRENPCLVFYRELSETEKEYDRATVLETLEGLRELEYKVIMKK